MWIQTRILNTIVNKFWSQSFHPKKTYSKLRVTRSQTDVAKKSNHAIIRIRCWANALENNRSEKFIQIQRLFNLRDFKLILLHYSSLFCFMECLHAFFLHHRSYICISIIIIFFFFLYFLYSALRCIITCKALINTFIIIIICITRSFL